MGVKVNWDKVPDFYPDTVGLVCKTSPKGYEKCYLWELLPAPKGRVWVEANVASGFPISNRSRPHLVTKRPTPPPSVQRSFLVVCKSLSDLSEARKSVSENLECEAVKVAQGVWVEANAEYTSSLLNDLAGC